MPRLRQVSRAEAHPNAQTLCQMDDRIVEIPAPGEA